MVSEAKEGLKKWMVYLLFDAGYAQVLP